MTVALATRPKLRVPTILDENGRPLPSPQLRKLTERNPRGQQTSSTHPEVGLTVESLASYQRQAEQGSPVRQMDMFDGLMERLPEMRGMFSERNEDVAGCDWAVVPPPDRDDKPSQLAAAALQEYLQYNVNAVVPSPTTSPALSFRSFLEHQGSNVPFGYAATNMMWDYVDGLIVPVQFEPVAHRRFGSPSADLAHQLWLIDAGIGRFQLQELEAGMWAVTRYAGRNPYAAGLMRSCSWWVLFSLLNFKQWQVFADMFGLPLAIGYYQEGAGEKSRLALEDAVRLIGQDGYAVLSDLTELVIKETVRGGDSSTVYPQIFALALNQITKLITGGALNTDVSSTGAGSYNAATVHESRAFKMKRRDATRIEDTFSESIGRTFVAWNGFDRAAPPRLKIKIARDELARAQTIEILGMAMPISKAQMREEFNLRTPTNKEDEMTFTPTEAPDPNRARQERKR